MKTCENDCEIYQTRMCKEDGNTTFGYEEHGAEVCPVFIPRSSGRGVVFGGEIMDIDMEIGDMVRYIGEKLPKCKDIDKLNTEVKLKFYDLAKRIEDIDNIMSNCGNCKHLRTGHDNGDTPADNCARYNMKLVFADDKACKSHDLVDAP